MKTVWKYPFAFPPKAGSGDVFWFPMPKGAEVLTVQIQHGEPQIWALVDPDAPEETRAFRIAGTGHPIAQDVTYIGTFQIAGGSLVFHLFEVTP